MGVPVYPQWLDLSALAHYMGRRFSGVVYGLVDPRYQGRVAYIGRSKAHVLLRYFQHISDGLEQNGQQCTPRMRWLAELAALHLQPGLVVVEHVGSSEARQIERESHWIADYQSRGEAWVNQASEIQRRHRRRVA